MLNLKESKHILALTFSPVHPHTATPPYCVENGAVMIMIIIMAPNDNDDDLHDNDKYRVQATSPTHPEFLVLRHVHCLFNGDYYDELHYFTFHKKTGSTVSKGTYLNMYENCDNRQ